MEIHSRAAGEQENQKNPSANRISLQARYLRQDVPTCLVGWIAKNTCHLFSVWHRRGMFACDLAWGSQPWEAGSYNPHCFYSLGWGETCPRLHHSKVPVIASPPAAMLHVLAFHLISVETASRLAKKYSAPGRRPDAHCEVSSLRRPRLGFCFPNSYHQKMDRGNSDASGIGGRPLCRRTHVLREGIDLTG